MIPVIAIIGRPNVGKSTLFNRLTKRRDALVANIAGLTRDRQYGEGKLAEKEYIVIDTGGIGEGELGVDQKLSEQTLQAIIEADIVFFLVDGRAGLIPSDQIIANHLRQQKKQIYLLVNKTDTIDPDTACADFFSLGLGEPYPIAAVHGRGVTQLIVDILADFPLIDKDIEIEYKNKGIKLAIVGRPNVGKSTLVNRILGEERVIVYDMPGTTRDSIYIPFERFGEKYTIIDTAGVRRRGRVTETIEKFSVVKTLQAIEDANVVLVLIDAQEALTEQDMHLMGFILDAGKAIVLGINKWDGLQHEQKEKIREQLKRKLAFVNFARMKFISALHGTGVGDLFKLVQEAYQSSMKHFSTSSLTNLLEEVVSQHQPPMVSGRRIKLRYAHQGGSNPPIIVIHGNQTDKLPMNYQRYLMNTFREKLKLRGTPIRLQLKTGDNPYKDKVNKLTPRQLRKRKRIQKR